VSEVSSLAGAAGAAFVLNILITFLLIKLSHHQQWYDVMDHRKIHNGDIPRIGGIGIFFSALIVFVVAIVLKQTLGFAEELQLTYWLVVLAGLAVIHFIGIMDDFSNISPRLKLFGQIAAAGAVIAFGYSFESVYIPFIHRSFSLGWFGPVLTFFWIVGVSNAVNLIDGLDGLAGTINLLILAFFGFFSMAYGSIFVALFSFTLCGALLAFMLFNMPPARIFMGDSGSLMLGFFLAVIPLFPAATELSGKVLPFIISLALIPIYDTLAAIVRRSLQGKAFYRPDKEHIHHKLLKLGLSNWSILLVVSVITVSLGVVAHLWVNSGKEWLTELLLALWLLYGAGYVAIGRRA
jgi:UDP-GlcNAc:undecaprenyl-phosphate GlcNAc-1-phosphate transferase